MQCMYGGGGCEKSIACSLGVCIKEAQGNQARKSRSVAMLGRVWLCLLFVFLKLLDPKRKAKLPRSLCCFDC